MTKCFKHANVKLVQFMRWHFCLKKPKRRSVYLVPVKSLHMIQNPRLVFNINTSSDLTSLGTSCHQHHD